MPKKTYRNFTMTQVKKHIVGIERLIMSPGWSLNNLVLLESWAARIHKRIKLTMTETKNQLVESGHMKEVDGHLVDNLDDTGKPLSIPLKTNETDFEQQQSQ